MLDFQARGRVLRVRHASHPSHALVRVGLREASGSVTVAVVERAPTGPLTAQLEIRTRTVRLSRPLGRRAVVDGATGRRIRARAPR